MKIVKYILFTIVIATAGCNTAKPKVQIPKKTNSDPRQTLRDSLFPSVWIYGMIQPQDKESQIVAQWYGFVFDIRGGCLTPQDNGSEEHNRKTDSILSARIGKDWQQRFNKSVDSLYSIDSLAISIARSNPYVKKFDTTTSKQYNEKYKFYINLNYTCHPTSDNNIKVVTFDGYGVFYKQVGRSRYLTVTVDLKKKKVVNIDKTVYSSW